MKRYHPLLITLHWLVAILIFVAMFVGSQVLHDMPNTDPEKINVLRAHAIAGMVIGVLMVIRLVTRFKTAHPPKATSGHAFLDKGASLAHWTLYILIFLMVISGISLFASAGLPEIVFKGSGAALPADFHDFPPSMVHGIVSKLLMLTILAHLIGWLFHQFILKDSLFSRMWFGRK